MENVSFDYSDLNGGTYDNHINNLPEDIISQMELAGGTGDGSLFPL